MNDFESERAAKTARFRQLAEKHENIAPGRHFAARERLEMIPLWVNQFWSGTIRRNDTAKTLHTAEARLAAIDKYRVEWWQEQRDFMVDRLAGSTRRFASPQIDFRRPPAEPLEMAHH